SSSSALSRFHQSAGSSSSNQKVRIACCMACSGCPDPDQCNQFRAAAPSYKISKGDHCPENGASCTGKRQALECNRRLGGERDLFRLPAEGANSHNRSGNSYCESDPTLSQQCRTASWREVARQPTEGASSPSTA